MGGILAVGRIAGPIAPKDFCPLISDFCGMVHCPLEAAAAWTAVQTAQQLAETFGDKEDLAHACHFQIPRL